MIQENRIPAQNANRAPLIKASSQSIMGNVLSDIKMAAFTKIKPPIGADAASISRSTDQGGVRNNGSLKVLPWYPSDESSRATSEEKSDDGAVLCRRREQLPAVRHPPRTTSPSVEAARAQANVAKEAGDKARDQARAEAVEAARLAEEVEKKRLAEEEAAAAAEAARRATEDRRMTNAIAEEAKEKYLAKEASAAAAESARIATQERRLAEEKIEVEKLAIEEGAARTVALQGQQQQQHMEKYPFSEVSTKTSEQQLQQHSEEVAVVAVKSYETEVNGPTGRTSETAAASNEDVSPKCKPSLTRREMMSMRRERARNRQLHRTTTPTKAVAASQAPTRPIPAPLSAGTQCSPPRVEVPKQQQEEAPAAATPKQSKSSKASARALARDRYARHKKMLHQRSHGCG